ncbi:MATE family efflux transporter [Aquibacillus salsiterrae]|uniref:Probable multidrug resistance protein NorM n=1 Tax=Aquibacillus salsiterrae TaxID=2950439 RepID=A0A9X3WDF7_9BACI|nr:MATE family efflux transporter [Aquibacillus salsiterrae]MDC3417597.1 MATE family efflux transporter [Aquibacillus salsiterrae]
MVNRLVRTKERIGNWLDQHFTGKTMHVKQMISIFIPVFVDQAFLIFMSFFNTAMISSAGVASVSAVSMVDSLNIFLIFVFIAVSTGGTVIIAQYKGSGNKVMVSKTATQAISATTLISVLLAILVIIFHKPLLTVLFGEADPEVLELARVYLIGSSISYPFIGVFQAVSGALRGIGETKPCLNLSLIMNLTNTILNVLFITVFHLGVTGLVIATLLARLLGMAASLFYMIKINETIRLKVKDALRLDFSIIKKVMFIGLPFAAEQIFFNGGKLLTQTFIVELGTLALTSYAIVNAIAMVLQIGPNSLGVTIVTVVGQSIGQKNSEDARKFTKSFMKLSSILFVLTAIIVLPFFPLMMNLFRAPDEIVPTIFILVMISAIAQPLLWSHSFLMPSALRAAGDSTFISVASLLSMWIVRVVIGYVLGITLGFGIIGVWVAMIVEWAVRGIIFTKRFNGQKWYAHKLI